MTITNKHHRKIASLITEQKDSALLNWSDYRWHMNHAVRDIDSFEKLLQIKFPKKKKQILEKTISIFPLSITPYYLSLIDRENYENDPIFRQCFPSPLELQKKDYEMVDSLEEDRDSPAPGITHRYPDRVLFTVSNICSMYCRFCTRKRKVGDKEYIPGKDEITQGIDYIKKNNNIRDVLLSGGDPLLLSDDYLDWILSEIKKIEHVEILRIGTRVPAVLPYRITEELVSMFKKHRPIWINTHFNHPREITKQSQKALGQLADAGIPLGNQSVLLSGINDCPRIIKTLMHKLLQNRVRPYYLYQCDLSEGLSHFRTPVGKGIEIMESLIGHTTGMAVPRYVIDAPGGGGKIPIMPTYVISWSTNKVVLRNYKGTIHTYKEPDSYKSFFCDRNCNECKMNLQLESATEHNVSGIEKLLSDYDETISIPH